MPDLSFVQDGQLRQSLESDFQELQRAYENQSWKSVHVLSGSIIEALLIETIFSLDNTASRDKYLKMNLSDIIDYASSRKIIGEREKNLASVVKEFRNLIHPGRVIRLSEKINRDTASVAMSLVSIIIDQIESEQSKRVGLNAEQIISKIQTDVSTGAIIRHLIEKVADAELIKLVNNSIPDIMIKDSGEKDYRNLQMYKSALILAFNRLNPLQIPIVERRVIEVIERESGEIGSVYANHVLTLGMVKKFSSQGQKIVMDYLVGRFRMSDRTTYENFSGFSTMGADYVKQVLEVLYDSAVNRLDYYEVEKLAAFLSLEDSQPDSDTNMLTNTSEEIYKSWLMTLEAGISSGNNWSDHRDRLERLHSGLDVLPF